MKIWTFVKMKLWGLLILSAFSLLFYFITYGPIMRQFFTIIKWSDIIEVSNATLMCVCGLPIVCSFIILSVVGIFKKGVEPLTVAKPFDTWLVIITIISLASGVISSVLFFIVISASSYSQCDFPNIKSTKYYVTDTALCKTINYKLIWNAQ